MKNFFAIFLQSLVNLTCQSYLPDFNGGHFVLVLTKVRCCHRSVVNSKLFINVS